ncbi:hypothetical protein [Brevibacterium oceani]|uniref:hypothetical protein n=1 Tax=Brevibacterium oceani TaxID=358099 RepID=UPI0015E771A8|nr:hypothetical protein [Brevibacterium oceani]
MGILATATDSRKKVTKERRKKPDELLGSVVRETAIPAAIELLKANERFAFPSGTTWVMLILSAEAIGGLSKRHGRDEAKGSIIELIDSDQIHTVATSEMLGEEVFGIIPDEETLLRMEEYSLLTGAEYGWAVVWQRQPSGELVVDAVGDAGQRDDDGNVVVSGFAQAKAVAAGSLDLKEAVGKNVWDEHSGAVDEEPGGQVSDETVDASASVETQQFDAVDDPDNDEIFDSVPEDADATSDGDEPVFDDVVFDDEAAFDDGPIDEGDLPSAIDDAPVFDEYDEDEGGYVAEEAQAAPEATPLADQDEVRSVLARRFLTEDLDLQIGLDTFNATFSIGAPVVQIDVPEGATEWLGDQIAQLNRQANADLAQLRYQHEDELRSLYITLMSKHAEEVIRDVAVDREGGVYKQLTEAAEVQRSEQLSGKEQRVRERRTEIGRDYEAQAKKMAEQAAIQAEIQYKERNRSKMEREQADAVAEIERLIENDYAFSRQEILRVRRQHAELKMATGETRILDVLREKQNEYFSTEEERLAQWKDEIQRIVADNREADIARSNALSEQQRTTDEIGVLRREQEDLLASMRTEHADRVRRMEDELDRTRQDAVTNLKAREAEWKHAVDLEKEKVDSVNRRNSDLITQLEMADTAAEKRHAARLGEVLADKESYATELERASALQSRYNKMIVAMIIGLPILGGLAGFIGGAAFGG